jgi:hypothetical protein
MPDYQPRRYHIPTHLGTPDKLDVPLFGITISLTMRQGVCFLLGGGLIFHLWQQSSGLVGLAGLFAHEVGPFLLACMTYVIAVHEIRGRHLEDWALVLASYLTRPKVFVWCSVIGERTTAPMTQETEDTPVRLIHDLNEEDEE